MCSERGYVLCVYKPFTKHFLGTNCGILNGRPPKSKYGLASNSKRFNATRELLTRNLRDLWLYLFTLQQHVVLSVSEIKPRTTLTKTDQNKPKKKLCFKALHLPLISAGHQLSLKFNYHYYCSPIEMGTKSIYHFEIAITCAFAGQSSGHGV